MTEERARKIWAILVEHGEAGELDGDDEFFVRYHCALTQMYSEWRFCGLLGFGGKFRTDHDRVYVDCYPEDRTPERDALMEKINQLLKEMV